MSREQTKRTAEVSGDPLARLKPVMEQPPAPNTTLVTIPESTNTALVTVTGLQPIVPIPDDVLGTEGRAMVDNALAELNPQTLELREVILLGTQAQEALSKHIDALLRTVTRTEAPVLYELFLKLQEGLEKVDLDELEQTVQRSHEPNWFIRTCDWIKLSNPAKRMKKTADTMREMLTQKSETILDLVKGMEAEAKQEVQQLISNLSMLDNLAEGYLESVKVFAVATAVAYELLTNVRAYEQELVTEANRTNDPQAIATARNYRNLVEQLQNRALTLRTAYEQVPAELEIMSTAKGAASTTLMETANGIRQQFNDLKSALVKWHVLLQVEELQASDMRRREIVQELRKHNVNVLERVATTAATMQGHNRFEDAQLLLGIAQGLGTLRDKLKLMGEERTKKFEEAERALTQARTIFSSLPHAS
jgi:hypothetical protein